MSPSLEIQVAVKMPTVATTTILESGEIVTSIPKALMCLKEDGWCVVARLEWQAKCRLERKAGLEPHASPAMPIIE